jgi:hypothetical protein
MENWYGALVGSRTGNSQLLWQEKGKSCLAETFERHGDDDQMMVRSEQNEKAV